MDDLDPRKPGETGFNILLLLGSLFFFYQAYQIAGFSSLSSPGAIPLAATAIMVITACIIVMNDFRRKAAVNSMREFFIQIMPLNVAVMCGMIMILAVVLNGLGFIITALVFLWASIWFLQRDRAIHAALIALICVTVIYVLFRLIFQVILPEGVIPERDIMAAIKHFFHGGQ